MDQKVTEILETGSKFVIPSIKYNKRDEQIEAEYLYNQISQISENHLCNENKTKKFSEDFKVLCKSYIGNNKKWHNQKREWETIKNFTKQQGVVLTKSDKGNSVVVKDDYILYKRISFFQWSKFS